MNICEISFFVTFKIEFQREIKNSFTTEFFFLHDIYLFFYKIIQSQQLIEKKKKEVEQTFQNEKEI